VAPCRAVPRSRGAVVEALQGGDDLRALVAGGLDEGHLPVGVGQLRRSVGGVLVEVAELLALPGVLVHERAGGAVELAQHLLELGSDVLQVHGSGAPR
jgi:hypothetical protein